MVWIAIAAGAGLLAAAFAAYQRLTRPEPGRLMAQVLARAAELDQSAARLRENEERLRLALAGGGRGTWDWDLLTGKVAWDAGHHQLWGYEPTSGPVEYSDWIDRVHPDDRPRCEAELAAARDAGTAYRSEYRLRLPCGEERWIEGRGSFLTDAGRPVRMVGVVEDVSDRKRLEAAEADARERERFLIALFDHCPVGIQVFTPDGLSVRMNETHRETLGLPEREYGVGVYNTRTDVTTPPAQRAAFDRAAGGEPTTLAEHLLDLSGPDMPWQTNGRRLWLDSTYFPVRDAAGRVEAVVAFVQDVTARKQAADELADRERRLQLVLDQMPVGFVTTDAGYRITYWNPAAERTFGYAAGEITGREPFGNMIPDEAGPQVRAVFARLRAGEVAESVNPNRTKDGRTIWCRWHNTPLTAVDGTFLGLIGMAQDVTALRDVQAALEASHARYRLLADAMRDTVSLHTPDGRVVYISPSTVALSGYTPDEWAALDWRATAHPDELPAMTASHAANLMGETTTVTWRLRRKDGEYVWLETLATPVVGADGAVESIVCCSRDVSDRKAAEAARERLEEQLRQAQKLEGIGQLAGGVAHDFNNLLTAIGGFADLLAAELTDGPSRSMAVEIRRASARGAGLTRQLLAFGRKQILKPETLDPNTVVADLARMLVRLLGEDVAFDSRLTPGVHAVRADRGQLEQVLVNLAVNARDAMPTGGTLSITSENLPPDPAAGRDRAFVRVSVADTGCGIPADVLPRIFEPFFTTKPVGQGTGLGLATVYGIVTQSGGTVRVTSEVGQGTRFDVELPAADEAAGSRLSAVRQWAGPPTGRTVLVVEDEEAVRSLSAFVLQQAGYRVLTAADGGEALELLARPGDVHLVLTDVVMPGMGGRELAEAVAEQRPGVPVGFLSGYTGDTVVRHGIAEERMAFLPKPFSPDQLTLFARRLIDPDPSGVG